MKLSFIAKVMRKRKCGMKIERKEGIYSHCEKQIIIMLLCNSSKNWFAPLCESITSIA